jgi:hypothetical protein
MIPCHAVLRRANQRVAAWRAQLLTSTRRPFLLRIPASESIYNTVTFDLGSNNPNFSTPVYMSNVGVSNPHWSSVLAGMLVQSIILYSVNDYYYNPATAQLGRGSGQIWSSSRRSAPSGSVVQQHSRK